MQDSSAKIKISAPGRTELAGNHTDHNLGKVIAAAIHLNITAVVQKTDDNIVFFRSNGFDDVIVNLIDLNPKPEEAGTTEALIRGIAAELKKRGYAAGGFKADTVSSVPAGSGLSSSAALEILLVKIFLMLYNRDKPEMSPVEIAQIGQKAENVYFGKPCGLMDQLACSYGSVIAIDFLNPAVPDVKKINLDLKSEGYALCIVNTGTSHADLTDDYSSIPAEMKKTAALFGKKVLRELDKKTVTDNASFIRKNLGDRAFLRALHFFNENERVDAVTEALEKKDFNAYLDNVNESGASSWQLLQNVFSQHNPRDQGIAAALALTEEFFKKQGLKTSLSKPARCACRVHGGGFAGTIQTYIPIDTEDRYRIFIEDAFGKGSVTSLELACNSI